MHCSNLEWTVSVRTLLFVSVIMFRLLAILIVIIRLRHDADLTLTLCENILSVVFLYIILADWRESWSRANFASERCRILLVFYQIYTTLVSITTAFIAVSRVELTSSMLGAHLMFDFLSNSTLPFIAVDVFSGRRTNALLFDAAADKRDEKHSDSELYVEMKVTTRD